MVGTREDWFPTPVWIFDHSEATNLKAALLTAIAGERGQDAAGVAGRSNVLGWQGRHDLHRRDGLRELVAFIEASVAEVVAFLNWDLAQVAPVLAGCWAFVNGPGASNAVHNHPNCYLSGVYYVATPDDCGDIYFVDPRSAPVMMPLPLTCATTWTYPKVVYRPRPGRMLIFPSWLNHGVEPNQSDQERVGISFNVGVRWLEPASGGR